MNDNARHYRRFHEAQEMLANSTRHLSAVLKEEGMTSRTKRLRDDVLRQRARVASFVLPKSNLHS